MILRLRQRAARSGVAAVSVVTCLLVVAFAVRTENVAASPHAQPPASTGSDAKEAVTPAGSDGGGLSNCPAGMVRVHGEHCEDAEFRCLRWLDPPPYQSLRCAEYAEPATCKGKRTHMSFCIDREEHREADSNLPRVNVSYLEAKAVCTAEGKHLCREAEWEFACEGPELRPYPYGFTRQSTTCNIDRTGLGGKDGKLRDLRAPLEAYPKCLSPFGVHNMTGNADEWVERDSPHRSVLRGGWWLPGRNRCRAATAEHGEGYSASQVGFRCCL